MFDTTIQIKNDNAAYRNIKTLSSKNKTRDIQEKLRLKNNHVILSKQLD